ncbi:hypothetical protein CN931_14415 [Bacillus sp. AFS054943]|uniref:Uncharacterized protein n=1 Tax=Bacillus cereus TaxID=1396 RepID=A0A2C1L3H4_BACCE|nr:MULTISPECIES: hypothetical protein [Bacillus]PGL82596.1 hypothetical protein CN931_14415 [Bacillus sp. AFS054943]PGT99425.1 hypothetical protein COD19_19070 [Bacillus cereus]
MRKLLSGKKVLEKETDEGSLYFVLPEEVLQKYVGLWGYLIRHEEFNQPVKWKNIYKMNSLDSYVLQDEFNPEEYEYMIYEETGVARELHRILASYGIHIENSLEEFLKLEKIPAAAVKEVKECLVAKECMNTYPEDFPVADGYEYIFEGEKKKFIIENDENYDDCTLYDQTDQFFPSYIVETYRKKVNEQYIYLFKTHYEEWYQYYDVDVSDNCWVLKGIYEDELESFPLSSYELIETEKRDIPEEEKIPNIDWEKLLDPNVEHDFYYSDKMFALSFLSKEGRFNVVNIDGEWKRYSEMVIKGEKPMSKWDDMIYIGTALQGEIKEERLTTAEMMEFAVYMREKKASTLLH